MNLSIDFNTLTLDEAAAIESITGRSLEAIGKAMQDPEAPKMEAMKALAAIAYKRENGGTMKAAVSAVGATSLTSFTEGVEVTSDANPTDESAQ